MKPLYSAIAASIVLASITVPALQARADDSVQTPAPTTAWQQGYADGVQCVADGPENCKFNNKYPYEDGDPDATTTARNNSDYIAGFIVGKSTAYSGK